MTSFIKLIKNYLLNTNFIQSTEQVWSLIFILAQWQKLQFQIEREKYENQCTDENLFFLIQILLDSLRVHLLAYECTTQSDQNCHRK